jgi:ERF superfamily
MENSEITSQSKIALKLVAAMKAIDAVGKRGHNVKHDYDYVKAADVANEVRKALNDAGIAFTYSLVREEHWEKPTLSGGLLYFCQLIVEMSFIDSETGESLSVNGVGWGTDTMDKAPYKAMTGALKYGLRMNFLIPDESDPENDAGQKELPVQTQSIQRKSEKMRQPENLDAEPVFDKNGDIIPPPSKPAFSQTAKSFSDRRVTEKMAKRFLAIALSARIEDGMTKDGAWEEINSYLGSLGIERAEEMLSKDYEQACNWAEEG